MNVAIIGVGRMGRRHVRVVKALGLTLIGVCDRRPDSLKLTETEEGVSPSIMFSDSEELFRKNRPEVVIVATTAPSHLQLVSAAVEAGAKIVLCEKPLACSLDDCDRMIEICAKRGVRLGVNHQMRYMEQYQRPKEIVTSAAFGGLASMTVVAGNFGFAMNATHYFESFRFLTDEFPTEVSAWFSPGKLPNPRGPDFEDRAGSVRVETASGKRLYMDLGHDQGHGMHVVYGGRFGRLCVDELTGRAHLVVREDQYRDLPTTRYGMPANETTLQIAPADVIAPSQAVLKAMLDGADYPDGTVGRQVIATLIAAYMSDESGHIPIKLSGALPTQRQFPWA